MTYARRVAVFVAVAAGLGAVGLLGGPLGPVALGAALLCAAGPWLAPSLAMAPWPLVTLGVLLGIGAWVGVGGPPRLALGASLIYLQVHRVLGRTGPSDDRVSLLLAGLMLVAAASSSENIGWLAAFAAWCGAMPVALLPAGFRVRSDSLLRLVAGLVAVALVLAAALFPVLPRLVQPADEPDPTRTGFANTVEPGAIHELQDDPSEVFRVQASPEFPEEPMYFRGVALDRFDGRAWSSSVPGERTAFLPPGNYPEDSVLLRFAGEAPDGALFTAGLVQHVESGGQPLRRDRHGAWRLERPAEDGELVEWLVVAKAPWGPGTALTGLDAPRPGAYLQLPDDLDPRVAEFAREIVGDERDPGRAVDRIADRLRMAFTYSRAPGDAGAEAPLTTFLFERRTGHCEYFASAMAVLLRSVSIPSRVVNGFVGGEFDPDSGHLVVRRYHAHAWTEAWVPGTGWVLVDATPGPGAPPARSGMARLGDRVRGWWEDQVLDFDGARQRHALVAAGSAVESALRPRARPSGFPWLGVGLIWGLATLVAVFADRGLRRVGARLAGEPSRGPRGPVDRAWRNARASVERRTGPAPRALPPLSVARWLGERDSGAAEALEELAWLLYRVRHGGEDAGELVVRARELQRLVQGAAP